MGRRWAVPPGQADGQAGMCCLLVDKEQFGVMALSAGSGGSFFRHVLGETLIRDALEVRSGLRVGVH